MEEGDSREHRAQEALSAVQIIGYLRGLVKGAWGGPRLNRLYGWGWAALSNACKWKVKVKSFSRVRLFTTPWTAACQAPPSMGFSRQEYWSGVPSPSLNEKTTSPQKRHSKFRSGIGSPSKWKQQKVRPPCTGLQERCKWKQWKKGELQVRAPSSRKVRFLQ